VNQKITGQEWKRGKERKKKGGERHNPNKGRGGQDQMELDDANNERRPKASRKWGEKSTRRTR